MAARVDHLITQLATRLPCTDAAPGDARVAVRAIDPDDPIVGDAMLLASELVTNALQHSGWVAGDELELRAELTRSHLRVEILDPGRTASEPHAAASDDVFGPIGLRLVTALADRWGFDRRADGQVVWAELDRR